MEYEEDFNALLYEIEQANKKRKTEQMKTALR